MGKEVIMNIGTAYVLLIRIFTGYAFCVVEISKIRPSPQETSLLSLLLQARHFFTLAMLHYPSLKRGVAPVKSKSAQSLINKKPD